MGFNSTYGVLQQDFPEVDSCMLRAVAVKHSNDVNAAVELISYLSKPLATVSPSKVINSSLDFSEVPNDNVCQDDVVKLIEDVRNKKKSLVSSMDSVISLAKEVECKEREAKQAKEEATLSCLDILVRVDELKQAVKGHKEANYMRVKQVYTEKAILATEMKELKHQLKNLSDEQNGSFGILDEMFGALEMRLATAITEIGAAKQEKQEKELHARVALACEEKEMEKVVGELVILKQESEENSKLQEFLMECGSAVNKLKGGSVFYFQDVELLQEKLDKTEESLKTLKGKNERETTMNDEQAKQRRLKGILNKLTPQNLEKLLVQVKEVEINNAETLTGLVDQIFDLALTSPTSCAMYVKFCSQLSTELPDFSKNGERITTRGLLLNKCQDEFQKGMERNANRTKETGDVKHIEENVMAQRRWLGNIRILGELYHSKMLSQKILRNCIEGLSQNPCEENVEALGILVSTVEDDIEENIRRFSALLRTHVLNLSFSV